MKKFYTLAIAALTVLSATAISPKNDVNANQQISTSKFEKKSNRSVLAERLSSRKSLKAPRKVEADDQAPIFDPIGESKKYMLGSTYYANTMFGLQYLTGTFASNIVWGDNNEVYIRDIISYASSGVYVKGTFDEATSKITVQLPQICYTMYDEGEEWNLYASLLEYYDDGEEDGYMNVAEEENFVVYTVNEDGSVVLDLNDGDPSDTRVLPTKIIGLVGDTTPEFDDWWGYGDSYQNFAEFTAETVTIPENVEFEEWRLIADNIQGTAQVGFDGDDVYITNFFDYLPEGTIKGRIDGGKVYFDVNQFMGELEGYYIFFDGVEWSDPTFASRELLPVFEMYYDAENKEISTENPLIDMLFNTCIGDYDPFTYYENPAFRYQSEADTNAAPKNPYVVYFEDISYQDGWDSWEGMIGWYIPNVNVNGYVLDTNRMYYNFFVNKEVYTFTTDEYFYIDQDYTDIPYNYTDDWDINVQDELHYFSYKCYDYESFGLQSFYVGSDGETYHSQIVIYTPDGEKSIESSFKEVKNVEFYNLQGQRVNNPQSGIFIAKTNFVDGTSAVSKVVK